MASESVPVLDVRSRTGFPMNTAPDLKALPHGFLDWYRELHERFTPWQQQFLSARQKTLKAALAGDLPDHLPPSVATESDWKIALPEWVRDQRNQMTGPADDAELVVKMLNSGAPGVMIDLEDSMANQWEHLELGVANVHAALRGELTYFDKKRDGEVAIRSSKTVAMVRARGLHLGQVLTGLDTAYGRRKGENLRNEDLTSASLFDVARVAYGVEVNDLKHPLTFYIPKSESAAEAEWWSALFKEIARKKGWPPDYIKCFALVESHSLAYQIEEFLYGLRDHILGLNLGRWDYMASLIHFNLSDPNWVLPDRNTIPHDVQFFQNLRLLIPFVCHRRGALAIGGMTALYPDRTNAEFNERALKVLAQDKKNEAVCGMDGAWTGHPDQNQIAVDQFPEPNQLEFVPKTERYPNLRPSVEGVGKRTVAGTRAAVRTVIRYRNGVLNGRGASLLDGYMEDLATDRIYRLMLAQRVQHRDKVEVMDENGKAVKHTPEFLSQIFDEELAKLLSDPKMMEAGTPETYRTARVISERMISTGEIDPV
jgi:malate synthase